MVCIISKKIAQAQRLHRLTTAHSPDQAHAVTWHLTSGELLIVVIREAQKSTVFFLDGECRIKETK